MVPFPVPVGVTVHQAESAVTFQFELEETLKLVFPAVAGTFWLDGRTMSVGAAAACVTVTEIGLPEEGVTVIVAIRTFVVRFSA